ncbi:MAG: class I SAM-dependent DNA methyltransferase, partial [Planctomycetes bacterium]|nr:class I SAM-dependent DNA methyltransferase [Planctomycetota bacterium]
MCELHDALKAGAFTGHELERLLVRILFCMFAEDTGIFPPDAFTQFIRTHTREDGSDLGQHLNHLFEVLDTAPGQHQPGLDEDLAAFPYVNGLLFRERLRTAVFNRAMRESLLCCCDFSWARISPAVFGSLFQGVIEDRVRRQQGAHYTSERDIMKVVRSLFLDELRAEFEQLKRDRSTRRRANLETFQQKLRALRFLDPACGCGNFLVLTYRELRLLEIEVLREIYGLEQRELNVRDLCEVDVDQFYGIEISEWPVRIAEVALWLMDHQMNAQAAEAFGQSFDRLPLRSSPHIVQANALRIDWNDVLPREKCSYVLGNPPFVGKHLMTKEQRQDMDVVWGETHGVGVLDYVTAWYRRAAEYIQGPGMVVGFVSTNSITQGEQVGVLWSELFQRYHVKIHFAHRTFPWESEARGASHVHVVIIGFGALDTAGKRIFDYEDDRVTVAQARNISPYLVEGPDVVVTSRRRPICDVPACQYGSKPADGGHLIIEEVDRRRFLEENPIARRYLRPLLCAEEYLYSIPRWCLWLVDASPADIRSIPGIRQRVQAVRSFREASIKAPTREKAALPALFAEIRQPATRYIVIPRHTSE